MQFEIRLYIRFFLLVIFSYQAVGSYFCFFIWKWQMAEQLEEIASTLPSEKLIKISKKYNGTVLKEFEEENAMYDVIRYQIHDNTIDYFCVDDSEEEQLQSNMDEDSALIQFKNKCRGATKNTLKKITQKSVAILPFDVNTYLCSVTIFPWQPHLEIISNSYKISIPPPKNV